MGHAQLSPSAWKRWSSCPGSVALCRDLPDTSSVHADEGTAAHEMAEHILLENEADKLYIRSSENPSLVVGWACAENGVPFTAEMYAFVTRYTDEVTSIVTVDDGELHVEQRLPISTWTGEGGAHGTADAVILLPDELVVADLKFGRGVEVDAEDNGQLMIYALAALEKFGGEPDKEMAEMLGEPWCGDRFKRVRLCIGQPRLGKWKEHAISVEELLAFGEEVKAAAAVARQPDAPLQPTPEGCRWCKAKATCPAASAQVVEQVFMADPSDFNDLLNPAEDGGKAPTYFQLMDKPHGEGWSAGFDVAGLGTERASAVLPALAAPYGFCSKDAPPSTTFFGELQKILQASSPADGLPDMDGSLLAIKHSMADFVEGWVKAVRAEVERRLLAGQPVPGFKLVQGRAGNRAWTDAAEAEKLLKHFRLKEAQMYDFKLISPTKALALGDLPNTAGPDDKPVLGPRQMKRLQEMVHRPEGSLSVAPESDPRAAVDVAPAASDFDDLL